MKLESYENLKSLYKQLNDVVSFNNIPTKFPVIRFFRKKKKTILS